MVFAVNKNLAAIKLKVDLLHLQSSNAKKSVRRQPRKTVFLGCGGVWWRIVRGKGGAVYFLKASVDGGILSVRRLARTYERRITRSVLLVRVRRRRYG